MLLYNTKSKLKSIPSAIQITIITASVLIASILCNVFLTLPASTNVLPSISGSYTALAFKPTNTVNHPPVVKVGPDQAVNENATVMLVGFAFDPDPNDKLSYSWIQTAGPAVTLKGPNTASPTFTAPSDISSNIELKFALTARDNKGAASINPAIVSIKVEHVNHPPVANAGSNQTVNAGYIATLDGSKSKDPDVGDTLTYSWVQTAGPHVTLIDANSPIATFTAPKNISSDTQMIFKLTVKDSENATSTDDVKVTDKYIQPANIPPTANAGTNQTAHAGDTVALDGRGSRDPDGSIVSYSWMQTSGPAVILNNADSSAPTFTAPTVSADTMLKFLLTVKALGIYTIRNEMPV